MEDGYGWSKHHFPHNTKPNGGALSKAPLAADSRLNTALVIKCAALALAERRIPLTAWESLSD